MRAIIKQIPNLFTLANLTCGVLAILTALSQHHNNQDLTYVASILIGFSLIFDFLDGFSAKLLKAQSPIGAQLDSLADMVTFGVAPMAIVIANYHPFINPLILFSLLIPLFSAIRLAKFNVDTEQTDFFKGIPTPANAIFWVGIILSTFHGTKINDYFFTFLIVSMSFLMVSNLKMIAFKFKDLSFKGDNVYRYLLIAGAILLTIICSLLGNIFAAIPLTIFFYIFLSIPYHFYKTKNG